MQQIIVHPRETLEQRLDVTQPNRPEQKPETNCPDSFMEFSSNGFMVWSSNGFMVW